MTYRMSSFLGKSTRYPRVLNGPTGGRSSGTRDGRQGRGMAAERPGIRRSWGGLRGMNGRIENWDGPRFTVKNWEGGGRENFVPSTR